MEISGHAFKSHSGQLSKVSPKNRLVAKKRETLSSKFIVVLFLLLRTILSSTIYIYYIYIYIYIYIYVFIYINIYVYREREIES